MLCAHSNQAFDLHGRPAFCLLRWPCSRKWALRTLVRIFSQSSSGSVATLDVCVFNKLCLCKFLVQFQLASCNPGESRAPEELHFHRLLIEQLLTERTRCASHDVLCYLFSKFSIFAFCSQINLSDSIRLLKCPDRSHSKRSLSLDSDFLPQFLILKLLVNNSSHHACDSDLSLFLQMFVQFKSPIVVVRNFLRRIR
jgi:hypothetical protein